jgi:hypothetical protein
MMNMKKLSNAIEEGRKALKGDSNDAEHDALFDIVEVWDLIVAKQRKKINDPK